MNAIQQPAVSVIVPVYSGKQYFAELLTLLRQQTLTSIELILVDDHGPDGTYAMAEAAAKEDSRVVLLRNPENRGPGFSRNHGLSAAKGEYVAFADADDILPLDYYERLYTQAKATGAVVVKGGRARYYVDGRVEISTLNDSIRAGLSRGEHLVNLFRSEHTTAIYQREHVCRNMACNADAFQDEDTMFILGAVHNLSAQQFSMVEDVYYYYRMSEDSLTRSLDARYLAESLKSLRAKLDYIVRQAPAEALARYAADLVEERLDWRYMNVLHEPRITKAEKADYLHEVLMVASQYARNYPWLKFHGIARRMMEGMTVAQYMDSVAGNAGTAGLVAGADKLALLVLEPTLKKKFWRYKLLAAVVPGSKRKRYKQKRNALKNLLKQCRQIKKEVWRQLLG